MIAMAMMIQAFPGKAYKVLEITHTTWLARKTGPNIFFLTWKYRSSRNEAELFWIVYWNNDVLM